jgi:type II secretory pathway pseudopilin PulG
MKTLLLETSKRSTGISAFTLVEAVFAGFIFAILLLLGVIGLQIFAARVSQITSAKLIFSADSREVLNQIRSDVRGASSVVVGNYTTNGAFSTIATGTNQIGNALKVFGSTDTNNFNIYYLDANADTLSYVSTNGVVTKMARNVVNTTCFQAEDFQGNTNTSPQNKCVIRVNLQFSTQEYGYAANRTNYYQLQTRVSPRAPDLE